MNKPRSEGWFAAHTLTAFAGLAIAYALFYLVLPPLGAIAPAVFANMAVAMARIHGKEAKRKGRELTNLETLKNAGWAIAATAFAATAWACFAASWYAGETYHPDAPFGGAVIAMIPFLIIGFTAVYISEKSRSG